MLRRSHKILSRLLQSPTHGHIDRLYKHPCKCVMISQRKKCLQFHLCHLYSTVPGEPPPVCLEGDPSLLDPSEEAATEDVNCFTVVPNFISLEEEDQLLVDIRQSLRGKKYQYDHWDGAIEGYRETEKSQWMEGSSHVIQRLKNVTQTAAPGKTLQTLTDIHVLDLAQDGHIKPHIDSVKFCGDVICGVSILSASVMKLQHEDNCLKRISALLPRLSLYIIRGVARFNYTHAIPTEQESFFKGSHILRERRISVICRTQPSTLESLN